METTTFRDIALCLERDVGTRVWLRTVLVTMEVPMRSAHAVILDVMNQHAFATSAEYHLR
jgi:hypothetical protein